MAMKRQWVWILSLVVLCLCAAAARADLEMPSYYVQGVPTVAGPEPNPGYDWWYGCSATSAGMMMGFYDRNGYGGLDYSNLVPGGVAEASTFGSAGALVNQTIASTGHQYDFYSAGPGRPYAYNTGGGVGYGYQLTNDDVAGPYHEFNCLADFMGTNQWALGNSNGSTTFYYYESGAKLTPYVLEYFGDEDRDGMYGVKEYVEYAGYQVADIYTQATSNIASSGFTFDNYMNEIDAGRVVMLHVEGHSMFGYGYDEDAGTVLLSDTWTSGLHTMTWGGSYAGMSMWGVTVLTLAGGEVVPVPAAVLLGMLGMGVAGLKLRKFA